MSGKVLAQFNTEEDATEYVNTLPIEQFHRYLIEPTIVGPMCYVVRDQWVQEKPKFRPSNGEASNGSQMTETDRFSRDLDWLYNRMQQLETEAAVLKTRIRSLENKQKVD